jgi:hypothetical protein
MWAFKQNIYKAKREDSVVILDPFDYMIVTYSYATDFTRDLDSATAFANTGTVEDNKPVGYNQSGYVTPFSYTPLNNAYLYQNGDDTGNGLGESIVINFKNLELAGISLNNDVRVELYAGWCLIPPQISGDVASVSVTTYSGGTISLPPPPLNTINSNGVIKDQFIHTNFPVIEGCGSNPKTHIGTIYYNLVTKIASVVFY